MSSNIQSCNGNSFAVPGLMTPTHCKEKFVFSVFNEMCDCNVKVPMICVKSTEAITVQYIKVRRQGCAEYTDLVIPSSEGGVTTVSVTSSVTEPDAEYFININPCLLDWCLGLHFVYACVDVDGVRHTFKFAIDLHNDVSKVDPEIASPGANVTYRRSRD